MRHGIKKNRSAVPCLLRADDGKPVVAYVADFEGNSAAVKPIAGEYERPLWLKREEIFLEDIELLRLLEEAYNTRDARTLSTLWRRAKPWEPHINNDKGTFEATR